MDKNKCSATANKNNIDLRKSDNEYYEDVSIGRGSKEWKKFCVFNAAFFRNIKESGIDNYLDSELLGVKVAARKAIIRGNDWHNTTEWKKFYEKASRIKKNIKMTKTIDAIINEIESQEPIPLNDAVLNKIVKYRIGDLFYDYISNSSDKNEELTKENYIKLYNRFKNHIKGAETFQFAVGLVKKNNERAFRVIMENGEEKYLFSSEIIKMYISKNCKKNMTKEERHRVVSLVTNRLSVGMVNISDILEAKISHSDAGKRNSMKYLVSHGVSMLSRYGNKYAHD